MKVFIIKESFYGNTQIIKKIVSNSSEIEGYKKASKENAKKAKELMAKNNVKIST